MLILSWRRDLLPRLSLLFLIAGLVLAVRMGTEVETELLHVETSHLAPLRAVPTRVPALALTVDVRWGEQEPQAILTVLAKHGVRATFFVSPEWAGAHPDLVTQLGRTGQELGLLIDATDVTPSRLAQHVSAWRNRDPDGLRWLRPTGSLAQPLVASAAALRLTVVQWTAALPAQPPELAVAAVAPWLRPGSILAVSADDDQPGAAPALDHLLTRLRAQGLHALPLGALVQVSPGTVPPGP